MRALTASLYLSLCLGTMLSGCGGSGAAGVNSEMEIVLSRTTDTQDLRDYEIFVTKDADLILNRSDPEDYLSSTNQPTWSDNYVVSRSDTSIRIGFRTRGTQTPYHVFVGVPLTSSEFESIEFAVNVNSTPGPVRIYNLTPGAVERLKSVAIYRNNANY